MENFADRLVAAIRKKNSRICVGLDPRPDQIPPALGPAPASFIPFCEGIVEAVAPIAAAIKPQVAFFEEYGSEGWKALEAVCRKVRDAGVPLIVDAKRGDIADTAESYARALFDHLQADAATVNPYLGADSLAPFLDRVRKGRGIFVLARTSNRGSSEIQGMVVDGLPLYARVARKVQEWARDTRGACGFLSAGVVVGATHPDEAAVLRRLCGDLLFLVPGYGAQGAGPREVTPAFVTGGGGAIVNASRSILYAWRRDARYGESRWAEAAAAAADAMREEINRALGV